MHRADLKTLREQVVKEEPDTENVAGEDETGYNDAKEEEEADDKETADDDDKETDDEDDNETQEEDAKNRDAVDRY